jgi:predicted nuclease of predicted toxin-antitoxin system
VKLLFDQNLSSKLVRALADLYPASLHVKDLNLQQTDDGIIWEYARQEGFMIVSKDSDFYKKALLFGHPPKLVWIRRGNCPTKQIELILRNNFIRIQNFSQESLFACLTLY